MRNQYWPQYRKSYSFIIGHDHNDFTTVTISSHVQNSTQGNNGSCVLRDEISPLLGGKQLSCIDFIWKLSEKMKKLKRRELRTDLCF